MNYAIITGDIIASSKLSPSNRLTFITSFEGFLKQLDKEFNSRSEVYRGDSFQLSVSDISQALRMALICKMFVRSFLFEASIASYPLDARIAIGIGKVDILGKKLGVSAGEAFEASGKLLDGMKSKKLGIAVNTNDSFQLELETSFYLLDTIISRTTALQCEVIFHKLFERTEHEIAGLLKIKQSAVNQRSRHGDWNAIAMLLKRFEKIYAVV